MTDTSLRPPEPVPVDDPRIDELRLLIGIIDRLRAPDGCPWDLEQTERTMAPSLVEEAFELQEALEGDDLSRAAREACGEAGDVLMNVVLIARISEQAGRFDMGDIARAISEKLVRRHPHVFGGVEVEGSEEVLTNWEAIKKAERAELDADTSALAGVPRALPALQRAARMCAKAISTGFRWDTVAGALAKVHEELSEVEAELPAEARESRDRPELEQERRAGLERELGDLLLATAFFGQYLGIDPEAATREALRRFELRFRSMEASLEGDPAERTLDEWMAAWRAAKAREGPVSGR